MARWTLREIVGDPVIELRWFGRWATPMWVDRQLMRHRDYRVDGVWVKACDRLLDWLRRWAIWMVEVDDA